ncbi:MAG: sigma-70 family RNA polymerase sigma factor, partial [Chitinophagaceae bacterium]
AEEEFNNDLKLIPDVMNPEKQTIQYETRRLIEQAIDQLPEKYRVVFIMREVEGMDVDKVADSLGITNVNVKIRTHRAKMMLKKDLYGLAQPDEAFVFGRKRCDRVTGSVMSRI